VHNINHIIQSRLTLWPCVCRRLRFLRRQSFLGWQAGARDEKHESRFNTESADERKLLTPRFSQVRLVAVSKLKPANDILALHGGPANHVHFGENYAQELGQKAELLPRSIRWHFIGGLQSSHCKALAKIPNLFVVSSVDSAKKAQMLNKTRGDLIASASQGQSPIPKLNVHVQVNTSGEESKSGVAPGPDVVALSRLVLTECPHLNLLGFMTIGAIARSVATTPETENEDFVRLREQRDLVSTELADLLAARGDEALPLELSMGMSEDFEGAIALGSSEVRVGSTIFGTRGPKSEAKIVV
jgi:PLP dependent protein